MAEGGLRRDIGLTGSAFLAFNGIVGAGIFGLPGTLHRDFGAFAPWLFLIFGLLILAIVLPFARLAACHERTGGPVTYAASLGPAVTFQTGWLYTLARVSSMAANANLFVDNVARLSPPFGTWVGRASLMVALIGALTLINIVGVKRAIRALDLLTLLKALPLIGLALWAIGHAAQGLPAPGPVPPLSALEASALVLLYAFVGFENATVPAGETADPRRTIPRAMIGTVIATAGLYFLVQLGYAAVMPAGPAPTTPLAALAETLIGPVGGTLLALTAMMSVAGNLGGAIISGPRVPFALAEQTLLPRWFGRINPRFATPANSILFIGALALVLALTGSFVWLAIVSTLARLIVYGTCIATLPRARPGAASWALMLAGLAVCVWAAAQSKWESWAMLGGFVAAGFVLYALARRQAGASSAETVSSIQPPPSTRSPS
ncbi:APC family permease [Allosphingosinicella sp.]|uniref:APC family permease n=1 Tax=Allosphingosinicella sp. TaxID=2823234 RepID=UPI0037832B25